MPVLTVSPVKITSISLLSGQILIRLGPKLKHPCKSVQETSKLHFRSDALAPESVPDLSTFISCGCEILFDLIAIPTWIFGAQNLEVEVLNKKCVGCTVVTSACQSRDEQTRAAGSKIILHLSQCLILLIAPRLQELRALHRGLTALLNIALLLQGR